MQDYSKYYLLEDFIFSEVRKNFLENGYLVPEEFFCIVIWKSNRAKTAIKRKLLQKGNLKSVVKGLTSQTFHAIGREKKLKLLLNQWKFHLPMASAILAVLYPNDFTIYDARVRGQLGIGDFSGRKNQVEEYFTKYLLAIRRIKFGKTLRDKDKYLWGKSFYKDLLKFINV